MPAASQIDARSMEKLRKIWAMRGSAHVGERESAENRAAHIVKLFGYTLADVPDLLKDVEPDQALARKEREERRAQKAEAENWHILWQRIRQPPLERAEVIKRYGSLKNAQSWQPKEQLLRVAVYQWSTFFDLGHQDRTYSLDGISEADYHLGGTIPERVLRAISNAYPLPSNITQAAAECEYWTVRRRDLELVADFEMDEYLDLPAVLRRRIVGKMLEHGLRASSVGEILLRFRYPGTQGMRMYEQVEEGLLRDLEHLAAQEKAARVQNRQSANQRDSQSQTASERRALVESLLSNMDAAQLSDREIARRVGVSPQTVGNVRRRMRT